jgi:hypothetical protein
MGKSVEIKISNFRFEISNLRFALALCCALAMCAPASAEPRPSGSGGGSVCSASTADRFLTGAARIDAIRFAALWPDLSPPQTPHPAVVRVISPEGATLSLGSGTLVDKNEEHGLVVTNWHVVRDARAPVEVVFPSGFRSTAKVIRMDRDWDLAALLISKPPVEPVPLSTAAPKPGDSLSIAGYGSGKYKMQSGRCTQYLSPGGNKPYEMLEMSAAARQGDSGGPILNSRGELTGVLFGAGDGKTTGSYGGRVHQFLALASTDLRRVPATHAPALPSSPREKSNGAVQLYANNVDAPRAAFAGQINPASAAPATETTAPKIASQTPLIAPPPVAINASPVRASPDDARPAAGTWFWGEELKCLLAAFGVAAILLQVLRLLSAK